MKLFYKLGTGLAAAAILGSTIATGAFASTVDISGNGTKSTNTVVLNNTCAVNVTQTNKTTSKVNANVTQETGNNTANDNTGGNVTVTSGNATNAITVSVDGSTNEASPSSCCACQTTVDATIAGNGKKSTNTVVTNDINANNLTQKNKTTSKVKATVKQKTGKNHANNNTDGTVDLTSGNTDNTLDVSVSSSSNTL